jgi:hypothetical protein
VKDFPIHIIPHLSEEELELRNKASDKTALIEGKKVFKKQKSDKDSLMYKSPIVNKEQDIHYDKQILTYDNIMNTLGEVKELVF